ncbi:hypothetical protein CT0861_00561 [Colletotrichum tofieldiae]|uniref:DUF6546 domain-containing protein n=1 Tax=Colletotrichum tofieldiae TaxID=708197 RepID=A0A166PET4_9PEZI|nr:hypothetical protein CT0861_00561 [Colletotrichum tofieldiae]
MMQLPSHRALQHIAIQAEGMRNPRWTSLSLELRRMILQSLANVLTSKELPIAIYASVSKEWQSLFEPLLWQKLTFRPWISKSNFQGFREAIRSPQRSLIKTISLYLRMEEYLCHRCLREVGGQHTLIERERVLFENLEELLSILALWTEDIPKSGISLELNGILAPNAGDRKWVSKRGRRRCVHRRSPAVLDLSAEIRSINSVVRKQGPVEVVPSITAISISPTISWSCSSILLFHLRDSFPCLQQLDFEQQLGTTQTFQQAIGNRAAFLIADRVPSLQRLSIWESRSKLISEAQSQSDSEEANGPAAVLQTAVPTSFHLKELAITYVIDARDFFSHFNFLISSGEASPSCMLERLVLSCQLGRLPVSPIEVDCLLVAASQAAACMPYLKILEVWSPGIGEGFLFRYEVRESEINLTMAATWQFDIMAWQYGRGYKTLRAWEEVASRHTYRRFNCAIESIDAVALPKLYSICRGLKSDEFIRRWRSC